MLNKLTLMTREATSVLHLMTGFSSFSLSRLSLASASLDSLPDTRPAPKSSARAFLSGEPELKRMSFNQSICVWMGMD